MPMSAAEAALRTAVDAGIDACFGNPGTTELPFVLALEKVPQMRAVLGLFEGVCTGAADGYARMKDAPGLTLLHLGPGFANGIAYLHDARRAHSPIVNIVGDMATWHAAADAPLSTDIPSLARPVSAWVRSSRFSTELPADMADAIAAASSAPGQIATLIAPQDCQSGPAPGPVAPRERGRAMRVTDDVIAGVASAVRRESHVALLLGGRALRACGLRAAGRIAGATGAALICETFPARMERGAMAPEVQRLPYFATDAIAMLSQYSGVVLVGAREPVSFFGYPGVPSRLISPDQNLYVLARPEEDAAGALEALVDGFPNRGVGLPKASSQSLLDRKAPIEGPLTREAFAAIVAALQPEGAIVMDEANTSGFAYYQLSESAPPFDWLCQPGGAIGLGPPCATGAAVACPDRPVINLQADGSAMYTLQALWTQAREGLNVTTLICNNRSYRVLAIELYKAGVKELAPETRRMLDLTGPCLDWVKLAGGMGVPGVRVDRAEALAPAFERALEEPGPHVIEMVLP